MKKSILCLVLVFMIVLSACSNDTVSKNGSGEKSDLKEIKTVYSGEYSSMNYHTDTTSHLQNFISSIMDGLVEFDRYGVMKPCLATSYEVSDDGKVYTFKLREGVKWYTYDNKEYAEVTADDFVYGMKHLLTNEYASQSANIVYNVIKNAEAYFNNEITDFNEVGIKALDKYTVEYTLNEPLPYFVGMTSYMPWFPLNEQFANEIGPENLGTSVDTILSNGCFIFTTWDFESRVIRERNENYWDKENVHISKITDVYNKESATIQADLFLRGEVTTATIPSSVQDEWLNDPERRAMMVKKTIYPHSGQLIINFDPGYEVEYAPQDWKTAVNNEDFRKSLFYAVDRKAVAVERQPYDWENAISNSIVQKGMFFADGVYYTDLEPIKEYANGNSYNEEKAQEHRDIAKKALEGKVNFPIQVVLTHSTSQSSVNQSQIIEQNLEKVLGTDYIDVVLKTYPSGNPTYTNGQFSIMSTSWGPDYADPISYFDIFLSDTGVGPIYGRTFMATEETEANGKTVFENLIIKADSEKFDIAKRYMLFAEAEKYLLDKALTIPLYRAGSGYEATYRDPFTGYCDQFGRNDAKVKGLVILDEPMGLDEYEVAYQKWLEEQNEAIKNEASYWK